LLRQLINNLNFKGMKSIRLLCTALVLVSMHSVTNLSAQEEESGPAFGVGADIVSNYIWRGTKLAVGPAIQPSVSFTAGNFEIGAWGSVSFTSGEGPESDLYLSYSFPFGLSLGVTDYYFPGTMYFDFSDTTGSHALEINAGFSTGGFSLSANYIPNEAGGAGSAGGDMYFEAGYDFSAFNIFVGAGDGWHTSDGEFGLCNVGIGTSREIKITDDFSIPVSGSIILNPEQEQFYVVIGFSL
jgi:hypothetical protein